MLFNILKSIVALLAGTDLYDVFNIIDKYLAVSDVAGVEYLFRGLDSLYERVLR